jgi:hypothetical protein
MCDVGGGASVGRIPGRIPGTRNRCAIAIGAFHRIIDNSYTPGHTK